MPSWQTRGPDSSCQSGALPRYGQGCKSFGRRTRSVNPCWCRSRSSMLWPGIQANFAARLELLYCTMQKSDALVARTMFSRLCSKPSRGCTVLGPQWVAKTENSGQGRGQSRGCQSVKGSRSRFQVLPHPPSRNNFAPLHHGELVLLPRGGAEGEGQQVLLEAGGPL